ncbi:MAG: hypothetical protein WCR66_13295 [Bacteroidota bacterium]
MKRKQKSIKLKPYHESLNVIDHMLVLCAVFAVGMGLQQTPEYNERVQKLNVVDVDFYEFMDKMMNDPKYDRPLKLTLNESICFYTLLHIASGLTGSDIFVKIINDKMGKPNFSDTPAAKKAAKDSFRTKFISIMKDIKKHIGESPELTKRITLLDREIPLDKLETFKY